MKTLINNETKTVKFDEDTLIYLGQTFDVSTFDINSLLVNLNDNENGDGKKWYAQTFAYSFDAQNYSEFVTKENFSVQNYMLPIYVAIQLTKSQSPNDLEKATTIYEHVNVDWQDKIVELESIIYAGVELDLFDESIVKYKTIYQLINEYPKWNFYDNQDINVKRWKSQCNAIAEGWGWTCIYFKTEPIPTEIVHTLVNNKLRNVVDIKRLHIQFPNNEFPKDQQSYSEWDMVLVDDIIIHVVIDKFQQAFGANKIPIEKDYLYFPKLNKLFRVAGAQPDNKFMGQAAWWVVNLSKFEDDDCVTIDQDLKDEMSGIPFFDEAIQNINTNPELETNIFNEFATFKKDTENSREKIAEKTVEEKKTVTQNMTNKLVDSSWHISMKETDKQREFYDKRLRIISVNPDQNSFPVTMYDNSGIDKRVLALQYSLSDYTIKNKFSLTVTDLLDFSFNYVLMSNFSGEIFDVCHNELTTFFTLEMKRNKLQLIDSTNQQTFLLDYVITQKELYNVVINYSGVLKQFAVKIFILNNGQKNLVYQNIYINNAIVSNSFDVSHVKLFGGNFLSGDITLDLNQKNILKDFVNPLLIKNNF